LCLPTASVLPVPNNEKFSKFSSYVQHSDKLSRLPLGSEYTA